MENLLAEFQESLQRLGVVKTDRLLLAVSGGLDSVVLSACSAMSGLDFGIAHANFQLRGTESERDEAFVRELAEKYHQPFLIRKFDTLKYAENEKCSIQVAARNLRYEWFKTLLGNEPEQFKFLLTAHQLDDNVETMLMHFFRGTGISGLTGMPKKNGRLIRPFLRIPRSRLQAFAISQDIAWVEDSSNASDDYTRNFFRNQLIPSALTIFPDLHQNLENNLNRFSEAAILYQQAIQLYKKKLLSMEGPEINIPILLLKKAVPLKTILYEIIKDYRFSPAQTDEVIRLMDSTNGKYISSSTHRIIKNRRWLIIAPLENVSVSYITIDKNESPVYYPEGRIQMREIKKEGTGHLSGLDGNEVLDAGKIQFPLLLRKWKTGDYFYPLGMKKKKKLSRFLIDQKLSKTAKEKVWVLVMDSQIIWVVGQRIDNRFRTGPATNKILLLKNESSILNR
jgi:tRNA(Ile)-lysidine synthase